MAGGLMSRDTGGRRRRRGHRAVSEINVTPFVDVMLVLLIVFMITAPLLTVGVPVDLPQTRAQNITEAEEPLVLTINADGDLFIQETQIEAAELVNRLIAITNANPEARIFVRGDRTIDYGSVVELMGRITTAGFTRVSLVAEMPNTADGGQ